MENELAGQIEDMIISGKLLSVIITYNTIIVFSSTLITCFEVA